MAIPIVIKFISGDVSRLGWGAVGGRTGARHGSARHTPLFFLTEYSSPARRDDISTADTNHTHAVYWRHSIMILHS